MDAHDADITAANRRGRKARAGMVCALLLCVLLALAASPRAADVPSGGRMLVVLAADGTVVYKRSFPEGSAFGIRFIHSVAKSPVIDWFSAPEGRLQLDRTVYQDFGAGLPHAPGPGQTMEQRDGHVIISGYHMPLPRFDVRVGRVAQHTLLLPEVWQEIPLASLAAPGAALTFTVRQETNLPEKK